MFFVDYCILFYDFVDGYEESEELSLWTSSSGTASWKFLHLTDEELGKRILQQQELQGTQGSKYSGNWLLYIF